MKIRAVILSGGKGSRLGGNIPKQYLEICDEPVISYTLKAFEKSNVDEMVIVASAEFKSLCGRIANFFNCKKVVSVVEGGSERYYSVLEGLRAFSDRHEADDIVLIHDGARPFIRPEVINDIIDETKKFGAVIAAAPCTDTIKIVNEEGVIVSTTVRRLTWAAQTPQAFFEKDLYEAYESVLASKLDTVDITDDAMIYQTAYPDRKVKVFDTGSENMKITTANDLLRAESIVKTLL